MHQPHALPHHQPAPASSSQACPPPHFNPRPLRPRHASVANAVARDLLEVSREGGRGECSCSSCPCAWVSHVPMPWPSFWVQSWSTSPPWLLASQAARGLTPLVCRACWQCGTRRSPCEPSRQCRSCRCRQTGQQHSMQSANPCTAVPACSLIPIFYP